MNKIKRILLAILQVYTFWFVSSVIVSFVIVLFPVVAKFILWDWTPVDGLWEMVRIGMVCGVPISIWASVALHKDEGLGNTIKLEEQND